MISTRIIISALALLAYSITCGFYDLIKSPLIGAANAQQVNDSVTAYGASRFLAHNGIEGIFFYTFILILAAVWLPPIFKKLFTKTQNTQS